MSKMLCIASDCSVVCSEKKIGISNSFLQLKFKLKLNSKCTSPSSPSPLFASSTFFLSRSHTPLFLRRKLLNPVAAIMFHQDPLVSDLVATALSGGIALSLLRLFEETAKRGIFDQRLNRKLVHLAVGLVFMLCWPLFSSGHQGALLAATIPGINIIRVLLVGLGVMKNEAMVKSMSRFGNYRELLKGPLYYASAITLASAVYWRSSPIAIATICNLCAGDGLADIIGRRLGHTKLPYNKNKSIAGSVAMASAGFFASLGYMYYFSSFGYMRESWDMTIGFLIASLASALVESLPLSTELDDNLTVPLTSLVVGSLVFR